MQTGSEREKSCSGGRGKHRISDWGKHSIYFPQWLSDFDVKYETFLCDGQWRLRIKIGPRF